ncbi:MAG TPA: DUF975 family protein, partial [Bacillota bacterium]|nr:DUF975 family protein [Bacillota bacterium]
MWTREMLKTRAKGVLKLSYWRAFLVSLILAAVGGNGGGSFNWNFGGGNASGNITNGFTGADGESAIVAIIVALVILTVALVILGLRIFLGYPLEVGGRRYFIRSTQQDFDLNSLGFAFQKARYFGIIKAMLWRALINFLWFLALIIPGIVKSYAYRMVPYILADNPEIGYKRALELSNQMTRGEKFAIFVLDLSFIGWYILGMLLLLVGVIFV